MTKIKNLLLNFLLFLFISLFLISGYLLYKEIMVYKQGSDEYASWAERAVSVPEGNNSADTPLLRVVDFIELEKVNPDIVGWIYIPDTVVDYPVVQTTNNDKYLNTLFSGEKNKAGTIFMDYRNNAGLTNDNTILYGHNMRNKSMFHVLSEYKKQEFYDSHKTAYYYTIDGTYELRIFSAYTTHATDDYTTTNYGDKKTARINELAARSDISPSFVVGSEDNIVTFSTCAYDYDDARFVVHATVHKARFGGND